MPDLISSVEQITAKQKARWDATEQLWWRRAWELLEAVGEFASPLSWIASKMGQMIVVPKVWDVKVSQYVNDADAMAWQAVSLLGPQSELFRMWAYNVDVTGEAAWCEVDGRWVLRSRASVYVTTAGNLYLDDYGRGFVGEAVVTKEPKGQPIDTLYRVFRPHPKAAKLSYTPVAAFLEDLEQLKLLRLVLNSKLNARLYMNGIWIFGQKVSMPTDAGTAGTPRKQTSFVTTLRRTVETNMKRKSTAADVAPIFMQVATGDVGDVVKQVYPEVSIDEREAEQRAEIRRTLREMLDIPVEIQTDLKDTNHWGQFQVREQAINDCLMPRAEALLEALSYSWYQTQLVALGMSPADAALRKLVPDPHRLYGSPSPEEMRQLYDRGEASGTALRAGSRVPDDAKADDDERIRIIGVKMGLPYLALWGTEAWNKINDADAWAKVGIKMGAPGDGIAAPERAPGVTNPGDPDDPASEVGK